jgi:hypothetical protein
MLGSTPRRGALATVRDFTCIGLSRQVELTMLSGKLARCLVDFVVLDSQCRPRQMRLGNQHEMLWIVGRVALLDDTGFSQIVQAGYWTCPTLDELHRSASSIWIRIPVRNLRLDASEFFRGG